jgi:hypothetical protein
MKQKNKEQTLLSEAGIIDIIKTRSEDPVWYGSFLRSYYQGETNSMFEEHSNISEVISDKDKEITSDMLSAVDAVLNTPVINKSEVETDIKVKTRGRPKGSKSVNKKLLKTISDGSASSSDISESTVKEAPAKSIKSDKVSDSIPLNSEGSKPLSAKAQAKAKEKKLKAKALAEAREEKALARKEKALAREEAKAAIKALNRPRGRPRKNPVEFEEPYTGPVKERRISLAESNQGEYMECFACNKKMVMLKRHLKESHGLTENQYRAMYDLPADYPLTAPSYSKRKRKAAELGKLGKHKRAPKVSVNTSAEDSYSSSLEMEVQH